MQSQISTGVPLPMSQEQAIQGIVQGQSQRPDGTWRKPVRVKPGYVAPELVPKYKAPHIRRREEEARKAAAAHQQQQAISESTQLAATEHHSLHSNQKTPVQLKPSLYAEHDSTHKRKNKAQHPLARDFEDSPQQFSKSPQENMFGKMNMYNDKIIHQAEGHRQPVSSMIRKGQNAGRGAEPMSHRCETREESKAQLYYRQQQQQQQHNDSRYGAAQQGNRKGNNRRRGQKQKLGRGSNGNHPYFVMNETSPLVRSFPDGEESKQSRAYYPQFMPSDGGPSYQKQQQQQQQET